jgi:hypothetical protein
LIYSCNRRSGRVVEGGTLLRCYTSQRGIEGSNPSSSAPEAPRSQEPAMARNWAGVAPALTTPTLPEYPPSWPRMPHSRSCICIHFTRVVIAFPVRHDLAQPGTSEIVPLVGRVEPQQVASWGLPGSVRTRKERSWQGKARRCSRLTYRPGVVDFGGSTRSGSRER